MPATQLKVYIDSFDPSEEGDKLVLEVGDQHLSCAVFRPAQNGVVALESFTFSKDEADHFDETFTKISSVSKLLGGAYKSAYLHVNTERAVLVPAYKFNKEIAADYLEITHGAIATDKRHYDTIEVDPAIVNVYQVPSTWAEVIQKHLAISSTTHVYSKVINRLLKERQGGQSLHVQVYHQRFTVCALNDGKLLLMQTFKYDHQDDVLYHLLNLCQQLSLPQATLYLSGYIDRQSNLYKELVKFFEELKLDVVENVGYPTDEEEHPAHFFTPFLSLFYENNFR